MVGEVGGGELVLCTVLILGWRCRCALSWDMKCRMFVRGYIGIGRGGWERCGCVGGGVDSGSEMGGLGGGRIGIGDWGLGTGFVGWGLGCG